MDADLREELIEKYVRGTCTKEEQNEVRNILSVDENFKKDLETQQAIFDALKVMEEKDRIASSYAIKEETKVVPLNTRKWFTYAAAASFILICMTFGWFLLRQEDQSTFVQIPVYELDSSLGFVRPETNPVDSTIVAVYSSREHSGTYSFDQDTLKLYVSRPDFALDILLLYDDETSQFTLDLGGKRFLIKETMSQKKLQPLINER